MKKVEKVWAELSANKVELATAKELNRLYSQIDRKIDGIKGASESASIANKTLRKAMETGRGAVRDFRSSITDVEADILRLENAMSQFEQSLKELGVSPKDSPDWNGANAMLQMAKDAVNKHSRQMKELVSTFNL